jgi:hypothetical protein
VTNNELATLSDIAAITELAKLTHLSLLHNPVTAVPHYRDFLIHKVEAVIVWCLLLLLLSCCCGCVLH